MTDQQRGRIMLVAAITLSACLLLIVGGFVSVVVRNNDGDAFRLLTDNLWQLVWPLVISIAALAGISHLPGISAGTNPASPADGSLSDAQGQPTNSAPTPPLPTTGA